MSEKQKWHATWIISTIVTIGATVIAVWKDLDMTPLIILVSITLALVVGLLWLTTPYKAHVGAKLVLSIAAVIAAGFVIYWAYKFDRPILQPEIQEATIQNQTDKPVALNLETLIENAGHQNGNVERWQLQLVLNGLSVDGRQLFGQPAPQQAVNEPDIASQDFPVNKPVRGWLFFSFPTISHDIAAADFTCGSPFLDKVQITLSVWDSKNKREWDQTKSLKDLGKDACIPMQTETEVVPLKKQPKSHTNPTPAITPAESNIQTLAEADRLARIYRVEHPNSAGLDPLRVWVNEELKKEGLPAQYSYFKAPGTTAEIYVPNSPQCPDGVTLIQNSTAVRGDVGFYIADPCVIVDHGLTIDSKHGYEVPKRQ